MGARSRPVIGVSGALVMAEQTYAVQAAGERSLRAVAEAAGGLPVVIPGLPETQDIGALIHLCDGILLTGARANVHPRHYGETPTPAHGPLDEGRDAVVLPLIRAAVAAGVPVLGVCRGVQELAVAFGAILHPEVRELPGRQNHRMRPGATDPIEIFAPRHRVRFRPGGVFHRLLGVEEAITNSLHGQAVIETGPRVIAEGWADDGTIEAVSIAGAPGFALGVQWHAEYEAACDPVSRALFGAFGAAARARAAVRGAG